MFWPDPTKRMLGSAEGVPRIRNGAPRLRVKSPGEPMKPHQEHVPGDNQLHASDGSSDSAARPRHISRRGLLAGAGAGVAAATLGWFPGARIPAGNASTLATPPNFPSSISLYQQTYTNWSQQISVADVWTCTPASDADVV